MLVVGICSVLLLVDSRLILILLLLDVHYRDQLVDMRLIRMLEAVIVIVLWVVSDTCFLLLVLLLCHIYPVISPCLSVYMQNRMQLLVLLDGLVVGIVDNEDDRVQESEHEVDTMKRQSDRQRMRMLLNMEGIAPVHLHSGLQLLEHWDNHEP